MATVRVACAPGRYARPVDDALANPAGSGTLDYESLLAGAERLLDDVDVALRRLAAGSYSTCEVCGSEIDEDRLASFPSDRTCAPHS